MAAVVVAGLQMEDGQNVAYALLPERRGVDGRRSEILMRDWLRGTTKEKLHILTFERWISSPLL
jgi:hypothetical protein